MASSATESQLSTLVTVLSDTLGARSELYSL
jgi:hypothetical protein